LTETEKDKIVDGECKKLGKRGVLLHVKYREELMQVFPEKGLLWLDIESAAGLSLAPENYGSIEDETVTKWIRRHVKGKPIKIRSHIEFELTQDLKRKYEQVCGLMNKINAKSIDHFKRFVEAFPDDVGNDEQLIQLIRNKLRFIFYDPAIYQARTDEMIEASKELIEEMDKFTTDLFTHFGFHRRIIIPRLGSKLDQALHHKVQERNVNACPSGTICMIIIPGLFNTATNKTLLQAHVNTSP